jgi:hypothetical protein
MASMKSSAADTSIKDHSYFSTSPLIMSNPP